jgi:hypothetical protein
LLGQLTLSGMIATHWHLLQPLLLSKECVRECLD